MVEPIIEFMNTHRLTGCWVKLCGIWLFSDALFSLALYIGKPGELWFKNHGVRLLRLVIGVALVMYG